MLRIDNLAKHLAADPGKRRVVAVLGDGPTAAQMSQMISRSAHQRGMRVVPRFPKTAQDILAEAADKPIGEEIFFLFHGGTDLLGDEHIPAVQRMIGKRSGVHACLTGTGFASGGVRACFAGSVSACYQAGFSVTDAGRRRMAEWVAWVGHVERTTAQRIVDGCEADEQRCYNVAARCALASDEISTEMLDAWICEFSRTGFVESLITGNLPQAAVYAAQVPEREYRAVLSRVTERLRLMDTLYPVVQKHPKPCKAALMESRQTMPVLQRYYKAAGAYSPADVVRRLTLVAHLQAMLVAHRERPGLMEALVMMW